MAKKFGKFLLFTATASAVAAGVCYYLKKKSDDDLAFASDDEEDYDNFSEDLDNGDAARSYVSLSKETEPEAESAEEETAEESVSEEESIKEETAEESVSVEDAQNDFTPLADQVQEKKEEQVEEFFDEEE